MKDTAGLLVRLRGRPLNQRKAMFFATFVIASALVFSFWTNQMYHRFGIVFLGRENSPGAPAETLQAESAHSQEGGLGRPFKVALENVSILKEDFINLFSSISSELDAAKSGEAPDGGAAAPSSSAPTPEVRPASSAANTPSGQSKNAKSKEPPLVAYLNANQNQPGKNLSAPRVSENKESPVEPQAATARGVQKEKPSRIVSIVMTNLAAMLQAFGDLYQYLTQ